MRHITAVVNTGLLQNGATVGVSALYSGNKKHYERFMGFNVADRLTTERPWTLHCEHSSTEEAVMRKAVCDDRLSQLLCLSDNKATTGKACDSHASTE